MFINGQWISSEKKLKVTNPATKELAYEADMGGEDEVRKAIDAAKQAFTEWADLPARTRCNYLITVAEMIKEESERLAQVVTNEMGKPIRDARSEINKAADYFIWFAEEAKRIYGETIPHDSNDKRLLVIKQPIGVVGAITPWNVPFGMLARKVAPALAAGCTMVVKPASQSPHSAIEMIKLFERAKLPKGVLNLVIAESSVVSKEFMASPDVRKITFTGSTEVGKKLYAESAQTMKRVSLELGGHSPFVVCEDADLDLATSDLLLTKFRSCGQLCTATNRIFVHESIVDEFTEKLIGKVKELKVGNGFDEDTVVGPLIDDSALRKVSNHVDEAVEKGANVLLGGRILTEDDYAKGNFYAPTVLNNVSKEMLIYKEETFGPVAPIITFSSEEKLLTMINHEQYGLASYLYTNDMSRTIRMMEKMEYGIIGINDPIPFVVQGPFGGLKESGIGKEGSHYGIDDYIEKKLVSVRFKK